MDQGRSGNGASASGKLDAARLDAWIEDAQPGAQIVYHSGNFAVAAGHGDQLDVSLDALRSTLQKEEGRGMLYLVQRKRRGFEARIVPGFDYLAIRSSRPTGRADRGPPRSRIGGMADQAVHEMRRFGGEFRR
jgi:hypothetical protein